jgi:hypothetical protein
MLEAGISIDFGTGEAAPYYRFARIRALIVL